MTVKNWSELGVKAKILIVVLGMLGIALIFCTIFLTPCQHKYVIWTTEQDATCTEEGIEVSKCTKCDEKCIKSIKKVPHSASDWIVDKEATCVEPGSKHKECLVCDSFILTEEISNLGGHDQIIVEFEKSGAIGSGVTYGCSRCEVEEQSVIEEIEIAIESSFEKTIINGCAYYKETFVVTSKGGCGKHKYKFEVYDNSSNKVVDEYTKAFSYDKSYEVTINDIILLENDYSIRVTTRDAVGNEKSEKCEFSIVKKDP